MDSVYIRKGKDLMSLTFYYTRITENTGDVGWLVVTTYAFHCHNGSFSQPEGKPRAALSTSRNEAKTLFILSSKSLFGDMMSRKY